MSATKSNVPNPAIESSHDTEFKWVGHMADDVGATYGPDPMALLIATNGSLLLSGTRGNFRIPRAAVKKVGRGKFYPWFFGAVRIHHDVPRMPRDLQFKPLREKPRAIIERLIALGYPAA